MPLHDHFEPPLSKDFPWSGIHSAWANAISRELNRGVLPAGYRAIPMVQLSGGAVEIDVAALKEYLTDAPFECDWKPSPPTGTCTVDIAGLDTFEVQIIYDNGELNLVAAIELVSPANKDRPSTRRAFCSKCANYLEQRIALVTIDVVTERSFNLHNQLCQMLEVDQDHLWKASPSIYAAAYRPIKENGHTRIEWWTSPLVVGAAMPQMPLWIGTDFCVQVDLEATYATACAELRMPDYLNRQNGRRR